MADKRNLPDDVSIVSQSSAAASSTGRADERADDRLADVASDPADEVPVPPAMSPAEIDERAQVIQALRNDETLPPADA
jgi:hypothetical protein